MEDEEPAEQLQYDMTFGRDMPSGQRQATGEMRKQRLFRHRRSMTTWLKASS